MASRRPTIDQDLVAHAQAAAEAEKAMPMRQAIRIYWRGILWSMMLSVALIMEGEWIYIPSAADIPQDTILSLYVPRVLTTL